MLLFQLNLTGSTATTGTAVYGELAITGYAPTTAGNSTGIAAYGQVTLTGQTVTGYSTTNDIAIYGSLEWTGYAPTVVSGTTGSAINGSTDYTGYAPTTSASSTTGIANNGSLALTGYAPTSYSPGSGNITQGDIDAIANAVWAHSSAVLIEQRLLEAWGRLGLDPTAPLITGQTTITFGAIVMAMTEAAGNITVTRQ